MGIVELPDVQIMFELITTISELSYEKAELESRILVAEAEITREATSNPKYFKEGKVPSQAFIDNAWKKTGFENELVHVRERIDKLTIDIVRTKSVLDLYKSIIEIWRTQTVNARASLE